MKGIVIPLSTPMLATVTMASVLLIGLLVFEQRRSLKGRLLLKPLVSLLFIIAALQQAPFQSAYGIWILAGLVLSFAGDVLLAIPGKKPFMAGIAMFMAAHLLYICGFASLEAFTDWAWWGGLGIAATGCGVYVWLYPHLGVLKLPVAAYVAIISLMLLGATGIARNTNLPLPGRGAVLQGALMFYLSDLFVARNRVISERFINRLVGLPMHYTGQFLLACSIGLLALLPG